MVVKEHQRAKRQAAQPQAESRSKSAPTTQDNPADASATHLTPYERMRQLLAARNDNVARIVSTVDGKAAFSCTSIH
jgi:hypothetical protein